VILVFLNTKSHLLFLMWYEKLERCSLSVPRAFDHQSQLFLASSVKRIGVAGAGEASNNLHTRAHRRTPVRSAR
jgi:hypothetical protein